MSAPVVGIFCSDLQLDEKAPLARSVEVDWLNTQGWAMSQLRNLHNKHDAPIFIAGDILENWKCSPRFISEMIDWLRDLDANTIPGNHDLPEHNYKQLQRSAYWTLVQARIINDLGDSVPREIGRLRVWPFPYGYPLKPLSVPKHDLLLDVALVHDYIWTDTTGRVGAPPDKRFASRVKDFKGYDAIFFGDNHKGFAMKPIDGCTVCNCGTFMRRHSDERGYQPRVYLLHSDGKVSIHFLDVNHDKFLNVPEKLAGMESTFNLDLTEFTQGIGKLEGQKLNFQQFVLDAIATEKPSKLIEVLLLKLIGAK